MNRLSLFVVALGLLAVGCGSSSSPSGASVPTFTATLLPSNETPPVTGPESTGSGTVTIKFNLTKDSSGNITAATADFFVSASGFPTSSALTAAHIHPGASGVPGPVYVSTGLTPGEVSFASGGAASFSKTSVSMPPDHAQAILNNPSGYYFNIHTGLNPGGVARGQLVQTQ